MGLYLSHLPVLFSPSAISLLLSAVDYNRLSAHPLFFPSYVVFSTVAPAFTFQFVSFTSLSLENVPLRITSE
jgi:hypothetical protein